MHKAWPRIWTRDYRETNPACGRVEVLNPGPSDFNTSALHCLLKIDSLFRGSYFWQDSCCMWREATSRMCRGYRFRQVWSTRASQGTHFTVSLNIFWAQFLTYPAVISRFSTLSWSRRLDLSVRHSKSLCLTTCLDHFVFDSEALGCRLHNLNYSQ